MEKQLKEFRQFFYNLSKVEFDVKSRELSLAHTATQEAMMQCGNILKVLDGKEVYANSKDATTGDKIEPMYDIKEDSEFEHDFDNLTHIETVKAIRGRIDRIETVYVEFILSNIRHLKPHDLTAFMVKELYNRIRKVTNWYGMELGRIRNEQEKK